MAMTVGKKGVRSDLNVTPMIDILLVLLIIFMVMTPLMMMQHLVEVPKRSEVEMPQEVNQDQFVLTFTKEGLIFLNQKRIERGRLAAELTDRFKDRREKTIFLNIDPEANYGDAMQIIDLTRNAGLEKLAVVTQKPGEKFQVPQEAAAP
jgi:biopolymer transport protein TolR